MDRVVIRDGERTVTITPGLAPPTGDPYNDGYFEVELRAPGLHVSRRVFVYGWTDLGGFFSDLAAAWRGWQGTKTWASPEYDLEITATFVAGGHVAFDFAVRDGPVHTWRTSLELTVDAGEDMSGLARDIASAVPPTSA